MEFLLNNYKMAGEDDDLVYFNGIAVQKDRTNSIPYDDDYFERYVGYEGTSIAILLNESRVAITEKYCKGPLLDIGIGSGEFIKSSNLKVYGYDINPLGVNWLKSRDLFVNPYDSKISVCGWTFWDSLEHFAGPQEILTLVEPGEHVFISIPIFNDIMLVKEWKHYRPNEHFYYFTTDGLIDYMKQSGFMLLEFNDAETRAGRQDILTFVFLRQS